MSQAERESSEAQEREAAFVVNKSAGTEDIYEEIVHRVVMAKGFCDSVIQNDTIRGLAETAGISDSACGHSELLNQAEALLAVLHKRLQKDAPGVAK